MSAESAVLSVCDPPVQMDGSASVAAADPIPEASGDYGVFSDTKGATYVISNARLAHRYYVEAQEKELMATLDGLVAEETWTPPDGELGAALQAQSPQTCANCWGSAHQTNPQ